MTIINCMNNFRFNIINYFKFNIIIMNIFAWSASALLRVLSILKGSIINFNIWGFMVCQTLPRFVLVMSNYPY
jgi:hypothetical protein